MWNAPVARDAPIDPRSSSITAHLNQFIDEELARQDGPWIDTYSYSTPIYIADPGAPAQPVHLAYDNPALNRAIAAVPIPTDAVPAAGTDASMTIVQPSTDTLWEFWQMQHALFAPTFVHATVSTGGHLPAGSYRYAVTALSRAGETGPGPTAAGVTYDAPSHGKVTVRWSGPVGAIGFKIYRGLGAAPLNLVATVMHPTDSYDQPGSEWTDDGTAVPKNVSPPASDTAATPDQWYARWGGRIEHVSQSPGYYQRELGSAGQVIEGADWGVTASGFPIAGGLITISDLRSGHIDHALQLLVPQAAANEFAAPAQRTDGLDPSPDAIPEGAHLRLDPKLDIAKLNLSPVAREIARAAQTYGLIVVDQTDGSVGFRAEDPTPLERQGKPNPYVTLFTNPATGEYEQPNFLLANLPWSHLQVLRMDLRYARSLG